MRRLVVIAALVCALAFTASALASPVFVITGRGWGHGIGMSQWGTYGYAVNGSKYRGILAHYYKGTSVAEGYFRTVTVLLASGRSSLSVGSDVNFTVTSGGSTSTLAAGTHTIKPSLVVTDVDGRQRTLASPATFKGGTKPIELGGSPYRQELVVRSDGSSLAAANRLSLDNYVRGVVPREVPASWPAEALKAQALAARSYALATGGHCSFGGSTAFCATTSDQVYGGMSAETAATNDAVTATAGEAVVYGSSVATTFFFSSSGGKTASKVDEWGGDPVPYLVSVDDPYDYHAPKHRWGPLVYTESQLRDKLGSLLPSGLRDMIVTRNASSRVAYVTAKGSGGQTQITGGTMRTRLGLNSTWFSVGVLLLERSRTRVVYGEKATLSGIARGVGAVYLERKRHGGEWTRVTQISPLADGSWSLAVKPVITTSYRLTSASATGTARTVSVVTYVGFYAPQPGSTTLTGIVKPVRSGLSVTLQQKQSDGSWRDLATGTTNAEGKFSFAMPGPGTYRALADAGAGYLLGGTPALTLTAG